MRAKVVKAMRRLSYGKEFDFRERKYYAAPDIPGTPSTPIVRAVYKDGKVVTPCIPGIRGRRAMTRGFCIADERRHYYQDLKRRYRLGTFAIG